MRQIIQEQDQKKEEKDKVKARQKRLGEIGSLSLNVENEGSMKPKKEAFKRINKHFSGSTTSVAAESQDDDEVWRIFKILCINFLRMS